MRIAICDDEQICLSLTAIIASEYQKAHPDRSMVFELFSPPEAMWEAAERIGGYDIYILDIIMPSMNGIELGLKLREAGYDGRINCLTSSADYAVDAFRVRAFDYILKPINKAAFFKSIDEAIIPISEKKDKALLVKLKDRCIKLTFGSIMYANLSKRTSRYHLVGSRTVESVTLRTTFSEAMADLLADKRFAMTGQSMVVNLSHVTEIKTDAVIFDHAYRAPSAKRTAANCAAFGRITCSAKCGNYGALAVRRRQTGVNNNKEAVK